MSCKYIYIAARYFMDKFGPEQEHYYLDDVKKLSCLTKKEHMKGNEFMDNFRYFIFILLHITEIDFYLDWFIHLVFNIVNIFFFFYFRYVQNTIFYLFMLKNIYVLIYVCSFLWCWIFIKVLQTRLNLLATNYEEICCMFHCQQ